MTTEEFNAAYRDLGISRAEFCRRLGISKRAGDYYAGGYRPVPKVVTVAARTVIREGRKK